VPHYQSLPRNQLENAVYQAEKMPDEYKDKISEEDAKTIKEAVEEAKKTKENADADKDEIEAALKALNDKIMPIGAKMYEAAAEDAKSDSDEKSDNKDEPVEGEVVDEKDKKSKK
jgi:molecular chaperone DnaK